MVLGLLMTTLGCEPEPGPFPLPADLPPAAAGPRVLNVTWSHHVVGDGVAGDGLPTTITCGWRSIGIDRRLVSVGLYAGPGNPWEYSWSVEFSEFETLNEPSEFTNSSEPGREFQRIVPSGVSRGWIMLDGIGAGGPIAGFAPGVELDSDWSCTHSDILSGWADSPTGMDVRIQLTCFGEVVREGRAHLTVTGLVMINDCLEVP
ncbi:hypothetical protein JYT86_00540 [bacterium AH-315-N03]|nr:hypothetical protein [bacterium AH-315-N03]